MIPDRREAIRWAVEYSHRDAERAQLVVAGKGHEEYQLVGGRRTHFSDREEIEACVRSLADDGGAR